MIHVADVSGVLWSFGIGPSVDVQERPGDVRGPVLAVRPNPSSGPVSVRLEGGLGALARILILDATGRCVRVLSGCGSEVLWDGRDQDGVPVGAGSYQFRSTAGSAGRVLILR
jgi:hypothetical protein